MKDKTSMERAFEIAAEGPCRSVEVIRRRLAREGYDPRQITGQSLSRQLLAISKQADARNDDP
jgi:hypothetical protein